MKRLVFPKIFVHHPEDDCYDDGSKIRYYYYKDRLPLSAINSKEYGAFVDIRLDELGFPYEMYKEDNHIIDEFNCGCDVDMDKLIANCEYILDKYIDNPVRVTPATPSRTEEDIDSEIEEIARSFGFEVEKAQFIDGRIAVNRINSGLASISVGKGYNADWSKWKETRIVKYRVEFSVIKIATCGSYEKIEWYEEYSNKLAKVVECLKKLDALDKTFERVVAM